MNFDDWKDKYYPVPADSETLDNDIKRLEHSILKWSGANKDVPEDYSLKYEDYLLLDDDIEECIVFASKTCALCNKYNIDCTSIDRHANRQHHSESCGRRMK